MDWDYSRLGFPTLLGRLRLAGEAALVVALSVSLIYAGQVKQRLVAERAQHNEYIAQVTASAVKQAALANQKEAEARELSSQIEQKGREHEEALHAAFADARRRVLDSARPGGAIPVPTASGATANPEGAPSDAGVSAGLRAGGAEEACAALTERYLLWQEFYDGVRRRVAEANYE